jgi:hypothetical protein
VDQAPTEIEAEKQKGIARFGRAFEQGDYIAIFAIQQVTIEIQNSLLEKLRNATNDDTVIDFTILTDESDIGRNKIKAALYDLYQRLYQSSKITRLSEPVVLDNIPLHVVGRKSLLPNAGPSEPVPRSTSDVQEVAPHIDGNQQQQKRRRSLFKFGRNSKSLDQPKQAISTEVKAFGSVDEKRSLLSTTPSHQSVQIPTFTYEAGEDDPFRI